MIAADRRVLIVGAAGMLGHKVWEHLRGRCQVWATVRQASPPPLPLFADSHVLTGIDVEDGAALQRVCRDVRPEAIVNCVGLVKQLRDAADPVAAISLNALFPHRLAACAARVGARVIHISTDCVFDGTRGGYRETDRTDADDLYGRSKALGEISGAGHLTLRTSIVGRELTGAHGLVEWFLSQRGGRVSGYRQARFSGVTTRVLAAVIGDVIERHRELNGIYHVAAAPIDKYALLTKLNAAFAAGVTIEPSDAVRIDRTLNGERFTEATGFTAPPWDEMVTELAREGRQYEEWRQVSV